MNVQQITEKIEPSEFSHKFKLYYKQPVEFGPGLGSERKKVATLEKELKNLGLKCPWYHHIWCPNPFYFADDVKVSYQHASIHPCDIMVEIHHTDVEIRAKSKERIISIETALQSKFILSSNEP